MFDRTNLKYEVEYDYERSACTCDADICRCTTIESAWIDEPPEKTVIDALFKKYKRDDSYIDRYCFDRICHAFKVYDTDLYDIDIGCGYYGEEIYGIYFENEEKVYNAFRKLLKLDSVLAKIKLCLKLEYGYLIDCVESATGAAIVEVNPADIVPAQREHFVRVSHAIHEEYKEYNLPIGVCVRDGGKYRLLDGYHRFAANKDRDKVDIILLV